MWLARIRRSRWAWITQQSRFDSTAIPDHQATYLHRLSTRRTPHKDAALKWIDSYAPASLTPLGPDMMKGDDYSPPASEMPLQ